MRKIFLIRILKILFRETAVTRINFPLIRIVVCSLRVRWVVLVLLNSSGCERAAQRDSAVSAVRPSRRTSQSHDEVAKKGA